MYNNYEKESNDRMNAEYDLKKAEEALDSKLRSLEKLVFGYNKNAEDAGITIETEEQAEARIIEELKQKVATGSATANELLMLGFTQARDEAHRSARAARKKALREQLERDLEEQRKRFPQAFGDR